MVCINQIYTAYTRCSDPGVPHGPLALLTLANMDPKPQIEFISLLGSDTNRGTTGTYGYVFKVLINSELFALKILSPLLFLLFFSLGEEKPVKPV